MGFSTQTSEMESSSFIHFDGKCNTSVIKEISRSGRAFEKGNGNQIKQMEKQKQDNEDKDQEAEQKNEVKGGTKSTENQLEIHR